VAAGALTRVDKWVQDWLFQRPGVTSRDIVIIGIDDEAFDLLAHNAREMCDMPSSDAVWGSVLRQHGYVRSIIPSSCPDCYTVGEFAEDFPRGTYVLGTGQHAVCVRDGVILDSWDSSREIPSFMWRRI
jgi:hypothetical protein